MADTPEQALIRLDPELVGAAWHPLAGGRTNRLWRVGAFTVKRFDPAAASPLFPNDAAAEARALTLFASSGLAPQLRAAGSDWLIYDHVTGSAWGAGDPAPVARMLHRLHGSRVAVTSFRAAPNGSAAVLDDARRICPLPDPPPDPQLGAVPAVPIHADVVAGNVLRTGSGPILIDWQCPALGDPAEDLCTFLSPAMWWLYTGALVDASFARSFLDAYPDAAVVERARLMMPVYQWRIAAHCAWKAKRGDVDYAAALRLVL